MDTDELARQARALIDRDQKIEAIKLVRETTGWGLRESKDYVDALARAALPALGATAKAALEQEARALIQQDRYAEAIRQVRERTGWGLGESKSYVDALTGSDTIDWVFVASNVRDLLDQGRRDAAVEWVVTRTKMGAQEARDYVGFMARSAQSPPDGWEFPAQAVFQVSELLAQNRKVEAVKLVRILTNWGLRESKDYVDTLEMDRGGNNHHRSAPPGPMQFSPPSKIGRNDPCPCGSGRKYKHCCGKKR